jgi:chromosome segregation ATPase
MEALEKNRQTRIAELNDEREKLLKENTLQTEKVKNLNEQITKLTEERLNDQQKLDTAKTALASEQKRLQETEAKATAGENELQKLRTNIKIQTDDVNNDKQQIAKLNQERDNDQKKLAIAERARDRYREDAARWKTLVQENPGAGIAINKQLIAIEQDLGQLDPKNRDAADEALHKSVAELRALESERMALVKPNEWRWSSRTASSQIIRRSKPRI